jgi:hypothetical protein
MAVVVFVHGIAQERKLQGELEREWLPSLATGLARAGYEALAAQSWNAAEGRRGDLNAAMALYGDLFLKPDQQGDAAESADPVLADHLSLEWLERAATRGSHPRQQETAARELAHATGMIGEETQAAGAVLRSAISGLSRLRFFAPHGMAFASAFVNRALAQVTTYLADPKIRAEAQGRVLALVGPETRVIVAHSLGTVVAFEAIHRLTDPLPLLVTLGSPLGLNTIIYQKLRPQPPTFPPVVQRWVNLADSDDFIAAEPNLTPLFGAGIPGAAAFEGAWTVDNGASPHDATFYLRHEQTARPIGSVLA